MLTRRGVLLASASIAAGVTMPNRTVLAKAAQPATPVNFDTPAGASSSGYFFTTDPQTFEVGEQFRLDCEGGQRWNIVIRRTDNPGEFRFEGQVEQ